MRSSSVLVYRRVGFCNFCGLCCNVNNWIVTERFTINPHVEYDDDGWCVHIDEDKRKCTIYGKPERPEICNQWPRGPTDMMTLLVPCEFGFEEI